MSIVDAGNSCVGLVWGWLLDRTGLPSRRPFLRTSLLIASTLAVTFEIVRIAGGMSGVLFAAAAAIGLLLHALWMGVLR